MNPYTTMTQNEYLDRANEAVKKFLGDKRYAVSVSISHESIKIKFTDADSKNNAIHTLETYGVQGLEEFNGGK